MAEDATAAEKRKQDAEIKKRYPSVKMDGQEGGGEGEAKAQTTTTKTLKCKKKALIQISNEEAGRVMRAIEDEPYYHGFMTRKEAEELMEKNGEFMVRKTDVAGIIHFVLSIYEANSPHHFIVKKTNKKRLFWLHVYCFKTLPELIQYHYRNREPICEQGILLLSPVFKADWQLNNEQVDRTSKLGQGAFGEVFKGNMQKSPFLPKVPVAIKTLHQSNMSSDDRIKFLREANLMLRLAHPNVIRFYGVCTAKEPIMIVMELAAGSLEGRIKDTKDPPTPFQKASFVFGAACGMEYLQLQKIMHRDLAARNCLLGKEDEVKISDFGLSMLGSEHKEKQLKKLPIPWMAPETLKKGKYSVKTDVWSYGVMIWEIYSQGEMPYGDMNGGEVKKFVCDKNILTVKGEIEPKVEEIRKKCQAFNPDERPDFIELCKIMEEWEGMHRIVEKVPLSQRISGLFTACRPQKKKRGDRQEDKAEDSKREAVTPTATPAATPVSAKA